MTTARALLEVVGDADLAVQTGQAYAGTPWQTGYSPLDAHLGGGIRSGELVLVGGPQGLGKTTFTLQMARNVAAAGGHAVYVCYEHDERTLLQRLIAMEAGLAGGEEAATLGEIAGRLAEPSESATGLLGRLRDLPYAEAALARITSYAERLRLVRASGRSTGIEEIRGVTRDGEPAVLFVDYLQKIPVGGEFPSEDERVTVTVEALKDLALEAAIPVVAIVAADKTGIREGRTRLHHMRGSTAIAYEADVALILNEKWHAVARHHLMYGTGQDRFREWIVCTVEKNRAGRADVDMEFRKCFAHAHLDPVGQGVTEELIDERIFRE